MCDVKGIALQYLAVPRCTRGLNRTDAWLDKNRSVKAQRVVFDTMNVSTNNIIIWSSFGPICPYSLTFHLFFALLQLKICDSSAQCSTVLTQCTLWYSR